MSLTCSTRFAYSPLLMVCAFVTMVGACGLEEVDGEGPDRIPADDPAIDERLDALEIVCESTLNVTGTFTPGATQPEDLKGCWPIGTWTVKATVDRLGCDPQPDLVEDYVYEVTYDEDASTHNVAFTNAPDDERVNLKISTAGDSLCHGAMDHYAEDGTVWALRPTLQLDGTLLGSGTYSVFKSDSF